MASSSDWYLCIVLTALRLSGYIYNCVQLCSIVSFNVTWPPPPRFPLPHQLFVIVHGQCVIDYAASQLAMLSSPLLWLAFCSIPSSLELRFILFIFSDINLTIAILNCFNQFVLNAQLKLNCKTFIFQIVVTTSRLFSMFTCLVFLITFGA